MTLGKTGLLRLLTVVLLAAAVAPGQGARDLSIADYKKRRDEAMFDAGQRHLQIGSWARKVGLVPQATTQFLRAVEVSEDRNDGAKTVLNYMRGLGDRFWTGNRTRATRPLLAQYHKRAGDAERQTRKARVDLARRAVAIDRLDEAKAHCLAALRSEATLDFDSKGRARIDGVVMPAELTGWLEAQTTQVNEKERVFEAAGDTAPKFPGVRERRTEELVVRTDLPGDAADRLHTLVMALVPHLEERLDGRPTRTLALFVFSKRADYDAYLKACGMEGYGAGSGLAEYGTFQTLVCAEGLLEADVNALVLHELTHLFFWGTAPAFMPDWYAEGLAETFGGQGTFTWDGRKLEVGGMMVRYRIAAAQQEPMSLRDLLAGDANQLLTVDRDKGTRFYAQSWALMRFLAQPDCPWHARFEHWEANCRGAVLGAVPGQVRGETATAGALFDRLFAEDLDKLEAAFTAWFAAL